MDDDDWVRVVKPDGARVEIPRSRLMDAKDQGYKTEDEAADEAQQAEYGTGADQAIAGVGGLLRGASLGVTDAITAGTVGAWNALTGGSVTGGEGPTLTPEARQRAQALGIEVPREDTRGAFARGYDAAIQYQDQVRAANPGTAIAGELVGGVGAALASGGSSLAAATPAAMAARAGAGLAGKAGGSALARGAAAGAIEGGLTGLVMGASRTTAEELESPTLVAQRILAEAGTGLLLGGAAGGAMGAVADVARSAARGAGKAAQKLAPTPAPVVAGPAPDDFAAVTQGLRSRPVRAEQIADPARGKIQTLVDSAKMARGGFDDVVSSATPRIRQNLDAVLQASDNIDEFGGIAAKKMANKLLTRADVGVDAPAIGGIYDDLAAHMDGFVEGMGETALSYDGGLANIKKLRKLLDENKRLSLDAFARGDVGDAFALIDQTKRTMGRAAKGLRNKPAQEMLRDLYPRAQKFLEDDRLWGEMAARQRAVNPYWAEAITRSRDSAVRRFTTRAGAKSVDGWDDMFRADDNAIMGFLRGELGTPGLGANEEAWRTYLRALAEDATARTQAWGSDALRQQAVQMNQAVKSIFDDLDAVALAKRDAVRGGAMLQQTSAEAMIGAVPGMGRASGAISGARQLAIGALQGGQGVATRIAKAAESVLTQAGQAVGRAAEGVGAAAASASRSAPAALTMGEDKYRERLAESLALQSAASPETLQLFEAGAELEQVDPVAAESLVTSALQRAQLISGKMPKPNNAAVFAPPPSLDPASERALHRTVEAAYNPVDAIERVAKLAHSPEDIEAIKAVFPELWADFRKRVEQNLRDPKAQRKPPPARERIALSIALGMPLDPSMEPQNLSASQIQAQQPMVQDERQAKSKNMAKGSRLGGLDKRDNVYASPVDKILDQR